MSSARFGRRGWTVIAFGLVGCTLAVVSVAVLALAATGVLATNGNAWTVELRIAGFAIRANVAGLARLATLPAVTQLADGRTLSTAAGDVRFARAGRRLIARCAPCTIRHPDVASVPIKLSLALTVERDNDALAGTLAVGDVEIPFGATLHHDRVDVRWSLTPTPVASVYAALADAIPEARTARIEGWLKAQGALSLPARKGSIAAALLDVDVGGLATELLQHGAFAIRCRSSDGSDRRMLTGDGEPTWLPVDTMGPYLAAAVVAAEDQRFFEHRGYDPAEIERLLAAFNDQPARGASTITQQLARTLYTGGERSIARKLRELMYAIEMERTLGKARILELYLNTVDWGPGTCGAKAAARTYFNRLPKHLTPLQAAWLAGILRNPRAAHAAHLTSAAPDRDRANWVLMQMRDFPRTDRARWAKGELAFARPRGTPRSTAPRPAPAAALAASGAPQR